MLDSAGLAVAIRCAASSIPIAFDANAAAGISGRNPDDIIAA